VAGPACRAVRRFGAHGLNGSRWWRFRADGNERGPADQVNAGPGWVCCGKGMSQHAPKGHGAKVLRGGAVEGFARQSAIQRYVERSVNAARRVRRGKVMKTGMAA
jgi:hypothetical protein